MLGVHSWDNRSKNLVTMITQELLSRQRARRLGCVMRETLSVPWLLVVVSNVPHTLTFGLGQPLAKTWRREGRKRIYES